MHGQTKHVNVKMLAAPSHGKSNFGSSSAPITVLLISKASFDRDYDVARNGRLR